MLDLAGGTTIYLAYGATNLRKSYQGLAAVVKLKFHLDSYSRCMFAFCNRTDAGHAGTPEKTGNQNSAFVLTSTQNIK